MPRPISITTMRWIQRIGGLALLVGVLSSAFTNCSSPSLPANQGGNTSQASTGVLTVSPLSQTIAASSTLQLVVTGGVSPYGYSVSQGGGTISTTGLFTAPSTSDVTVISVTDATGLQVVSTITTYSSATTVTASPLVITPSATSLNPGQTATFTTSGGTAPYTLSLSSGTGTLANGVFTAGSTAGGAVITVTDSAGAVAQTTITIVVPAPTQLWTWSGLLYQTSCPSLCDGVEYAVCSGTACPAARIQCYTASPRGQPGHPIGTTQTTTPNGWMCSYF